MKALLALVLFSLSTAFAATPAKQAASAAAPGASAKKSSVDPLKGLKKIVDKMADVTWYQPTSVPRFVNSNAFYLYFGQNDSGTFTPLRLVMRYKADDWLFVENAWAKADGVRVELPQVRRWERDNGSGDIWEWSDEPVRDSASIAALRVLANAKSATVRFNGNKYYGDRTLTVAQLKSLREVIAAYESATGKPWAK